MLNVLLINDGSGHAGLLAQMLAQADVCIVGQIAPCMGLEHVIAGLQPDLVLIDSDAPSRDTLEAVCVASTESRRPVVMFTGNGSRDILREALKAGVSAYVVGQVEAVRIESVLAVAIERFAIEQALREELADTRVRLAERQWVDKAKGLLMQLKGISEDEAYKRLRAEAMKRQKRIGEIAQAMVESAAWLA